MTYNPTINTEAVTNRHVGTINLTGHLPALKPNSANILDSKSMIEINRKFSKYKKIEAKTDVPWKVVAAIDMANVSSFTTAAAKKVQSYAVSKGLRLSPDSDAQDVIKLLNVFKKEHPDKSGILDSCLSYYLRIDQMYR